MSGTSVKKVVGAARFRPTKWLKAAGYSPQVFVFRNLQSGQVLYSQLPNFTDKQIDNQFQRPNWENKKPSTRRDLWKCMCVIDMPNHEGSVQLYQNLVRLRYLRDVTLKGDAKAMRKKNGDGNTWFSGLYRPTYTQEAVADIIESLRKIKHNDAEQKLIDSDSNAITIHWEDIWRMGDKTKHWDPLLLNINHTEIERTGNTSREESVILKQLGELAKQATDKSKA
ncbi:hypothetical protein TPHA_0D01860 [Tetrapisispora phaffii CBS 4417]|uniref:Large ribosomal subunit protein mL67 n=1 Tax=Tetrapisispora phaffii (strain ATCC 24235 / CBS 4417 / NBRC 1672 / NRRL Y-8282 / UCD 70-5) TaxID=1071381 RepID=G8BSK4_TETPH|nr:hypothetical protein TPHA_0D01860 [Tetrapisispora phaffii CBS 4417]CCE62825.1 hypothetical protein TPHA_0D01860 [Tetrapisispora phaffii CBS 4417]